MTPRRLVVGAWLVWQWCLLFSSRTSTLPLPLLVEVFASDASADGLRVIPRAQGKDFHVTGASFPHASRHPGVGEPPTPTEPPPGVENRTRVVKADEIGLEKDQPPVLNEPPAADENRTASTSEELNLHALPVAQSDPGKVSYLRKTQEKEVAVYKRKVSSASLKVYTKCKGGDCKAMSFPSRSPDGWVTVALDGVADFESLPAALNAGAKNIFIRNGEHVIDSTIIIGQTNANVHIRGETKENTVLRFTGDCSFIVVFNTAGVTISNLSLNAKSANLQSSNMWEVIGVVNSNSISIADTIIFAPSNMHAIFFAGPFYASSRMYATFFTGSTNKYADGGQETANAYKEGYLDDGNTAKNNHIYSDYDGDALVFTLQKNGKVIDNKVVSAAISFYMNMDSICNQNTVLDSAINAIYVTVPSDRVAIEDNKIIRAKKSGIKIARNQDHRKDEVQTARIRQPVAYRAAGIYVAGNQIFDTQLHGLDIELTQSTIVTHNTISRTDYSGIHIRSSDSIQVNHNRIEDFGLQWESSPDQSAGVYGDGDVTAAMITYNILIDFMDHNVMHRDGSEGRHGIKIVPALRGAKKQHVIRNNVIHGNFFDKGISAPEGSIQADNSVVQVS